MGRCLGYVNGGAAQTETLPGGLLDFSRSIIFLRAADAGAALEIGRDDVYLRTGVWADVRVCPFGRVCRPEELPAAS